MNISSAELPSQLADARSQVEAYCQSLVDTGKARWRINNDGDTELHLEGGEAYLFGKFGVTRLK